MIFSSNIFIKNFVNWKLPSLWLFVIAMLFASCGNTKYLKDGEMLYTGASVKVEKGKRVKGRKAIVKKAENVILPKPNKKFLGMKMKLWFYNVAGEPKKKGFKHFVKNKLGEKPVLFSQVTPNKVRDHIDATLFNNGYFGSYSNFELKNKGKKVSINYQLFLSEPYLIDSIKFMPVDHIILLTINESLKNSILKKGDLYNLENIQKEKARIDEFLKTKGFFMFMIPKLFASLYSWQRFGFV